MNHATEWDEAHKRRLMIADKPFSSLVHFADSDSVRPADHVGKALDIGCGTGRSAEWLCSRGWITSGFDSSEHAIRRALFRLAAKAPNTHDPAHTFPTLMVSDAARRPWPYRSDSFDIAVDIRSLENLTKEEIVGAWWEVHRVLRLNGWFLSITASALRDDSLTTAGKVSKMEENEFEMLASMGFKLSCASVTSVEGERIVQDWQIVARKIKT